MTLQLHHIGEPLLTRMFTRLADQGRLDTVQCVRSHVPFAGILSSAGVTGEYRFSSDVQLDPLDSKVGPLTFDGLHQVDVLASGTSTVAVGIEAKLGVDRLTGKTFRDRFLSPIGLSSHKPPRPMGSMISVLDHRFAPKIGTPPLHAAGCELAKTWVLVLRSVVWSRWESGKTPEVDLSSNARVILFEDVARSFGTPTEFNDLVDDIIRGNHFERWKLGTT